MEQKMRYLPGFVEFTCFKTFNLGKGRGEKGRKEGRKEGRKKERRKRGREEGRKVPKVHIYIAKFFNAYTP